MSRIRSPRRSTATPPIRRPYRVQAAHRFLNSVVAPEKTEITAPINSPGWQVIVYNNDVNTYEEVIAALRYGTGCSQDEAYIEAWEIDHFGSCVVHRADQDECQAAALVIATIGIRVEALPSD